MNPLMKIAGKLSGVAFLAWLSSLIWPPLGFIVAVLGIMQISAEERS